MVKYKFVGVRFREDDTELIRQTAFALGWTVSDFIRWAVRKELAQLKLEPFYKKNFEIDKECGT